MSDISTARSVILGRIRESLQDVSANEEPADIRVERAYLRHGTSGSEEIVERFLERVADYKVAVRRVAPGELAQALATACARRNARRLAVPVDLPSDWLPAGIELLRDDPPLSNEQLDASDGVLTGCALGIAQTGTIVLDGGPAQGRRALTLLPDYHLCVIYEAQIVELVPQAITRLAEAIRLHNRPLTFISGPSATSDIELKRVEGVHGPRVLDVFVVCS